MIHRIVFALVLSSLFTFVACDAQQVPSVNSPQANDTNLLPLQPSVREKVIARTFISLLERMHISQETIGEKQSPEALRLFIKALDPAKVYFYQSDIDDFRQKYGRSFCVLAKQQNVQPAFEIYNRYLDRVKERSVQIQQILDSNLDFTQDEELVRDKLKDFSIDPAVIQQKGLQGFAQTPEESYDRWRKRIKADILILKADAMENAKKEKKTDDGVAKKTDGPVERLKKRYTSFRKRMLFEAHFETGKVLDDVRRAANDEVLETLLTAIGETLDPHTTYMPPSMLESFNTMMGKSLEGIGATLMSEDGYTLVKKIVKGGPADKSGLLKVDDKIRGVGQGKNGKIEDVVDLKISDVVKQIRGPKGTLVRLEVVPNDGGATKIIEITREKVTLDDQAAKSEVFEFGKKTDGTPYKFGFIELPDFYFDMEAARRGDSNARSTTTDVKKYIDQFVEQNVDAVILDLRNNGGGSLAEAVSLTGLFISTGNVVQTKDESSSRPQQRDDMDPSCAWTGPLVVLTSKFSASASEIFAGAIKDYKRGLIIGDTVTHGKGTVQQMQDLSEKLFMSEEASLGAGKITIQGFYRPIGVSTQKIGVEADVVLPSFSDALEDIQESDLDNVLTFNKIAPAARFLPKTAYIHPQLSAELQKIADRDVKDNTEFQKLQNRIAAYKEIRARRSTPLNEKKYLEEQERFNADKLEKEELEDVLDRNESAIKRNYYVDEVLKLSADYLNLTQESGIDFPKERQIVQPRRGIFGW